MRRKITVGVIIFICFLFQCTVFQAIALGSIVPNLLIIVTASFGFMRGKTEGLIIGFICGFLIDIFYGDVLGFYALIYMYIGYGNGFFNKVFFYEDIKLPIILIMVSDLLYNLTIYLFLFVLRAKFGFFYYLRYIILPEIIYTAVVSIILYRLIMWINRKLEKYEKRSASKFV